MKTSQYCDVLKVLNLAPGASVTANVRTDDAHFVVERVQSVIQLTAANTSHIAGTILGASAVSLSTSGINDPNACQVLVNLKLEQENLTNDDVPSAAYAPCPDREGWLRTPIVIPPRATLSCKFTNNAALALDCRIVLFGYKSDVNPHQGA